MTVGSRHHVYDLNVSFAGVGLFAAGHAIWPAFSLSLMLLGQRIQIRHQMPDLVSLTTSHGAASDLSGQIVGTPSDNTTEDATFEDPYTEDATLEVKEPEVAKKETEETIKEVAVGEDVAAIVEGEDEPSGQIAEPQSDNAVDGDQSKNFTINGVEWKQWFRNLLLPFK